MHHLSMVNLRIKLAAVSQSGSQYEPIGLINGDNTSYVSNKKKQKQYDEHQLGNLSMSSTARRRKPWNTGSDWVGCYLPIVYNLI